MNQLKLLFIPLLLILFSCKSSILEDPSTTIQFKVPYEAMVKLTIENSYNTLIVTLIDDQQLPPGTHSSRFTMDDLAEGVYFYKLEIKGIGQNSSSYEITRHLLLAKS